MAVTKKQVLEKLKTVNDPELRLSIVSLGLVYKIKVDKGKDVFTQVTLTTPGCPLIEVIMQDIHSSIKSIPGVGKVKVQLTFDPPWKPEMMSEEAKATLGIEE